MLYFGPWKTLSILLVLLLGVLFTLPNMLPEDVRYEMQPDGNGGFERALDINGEPLPPKLPWRFLPHQSVNLGLDLQGGAHLVFEVDINQVERDRLGTLREDATTALRQQPLISGTAQLEADDVLVSVAREEDAEEALQRLRDLSEPITDSLTGAPGLSQTLSVRRDGDDPRLIRLSITEEYKTNIANRTVAQSIEVIRRRLDGLGTSEPVIARQGDDRVLVQVPGADNPQEIIELVGAEARLEFRMVTDVNAGPNCDARIPPRMEILFSDNPAERCLVVESRPRLTGENLQSARVQQVDGQVVVGFTFDRQGGLIFGDLTAENVGRRFAAVLDGEIVSAPRINSPILQGSGIIQGNFTFPEAQALVVQLNAGALPAQLTAVEQRSVGPGLGEDSIRAGQIAIVIGFVGVIVFMLMAYGVFGVFSTVALLTNVILIIGALSGLRATLTLPGIAGIILTIGMAVDANVLIFERIREEARQGRTIANAIEAGYSRALAAILDANITTFIAAAVLFMLGAGPVRGFAVTLGIGIVTSVFTAFMFSRLLAVGWLRGFKPKTLPL